MLSIFYRYLLSISSITKNDLIQVNSLLLYPRLIRIIPRSSLFRIPLMPLTKQGDELVHAVGQGGRDEAETGCVTVN